MTADALWVKTEIYSGQNHTTKLKQLNGKEPQHRGADCLPIKLDISEI